MDKKRIIKAVLPKQISSYLILLGPKGYLHYIIFQKIFRINSNVPWPVHFTSVVKNPERIKKGIYNPGLSPRCYIDGRNGILIGDNTWIGPGVSIISMNHNLNNYKKYNKEKPIAIGNNCWLATNCIILPGITLGNHVIVAAGSVVTKSFIEDNILLAGIPAKIVKNLNNYEEV